MFGRCLTDADGSVVEVIDPGRHNADSGPDFFNSKVMIDGVRWVGNVEIHVRASDWSRHGHNGDPAYDSVILHVVGISDKRVRRGDGSVIPQVEVTMPENFYRAYSLLSEGAASVRCGNLLPQLPGLIVSDWLESLSVERLQQKGNRVADILRSTGSDWEQTCFVLFARSLGFGLNGEPFEWLARSIPLKLLHHHSDNPLQLQSLLFGQAAMLDPSLHIFDEYYQLMCREYYFLARKYGLRPMRPGLWKYARTRPHNFPHRRIAYLAKACEGGFSIFSRILERAGHTEALRQIFAWRLDGYWGSHFSFDVEGTKVPAAMTGASVGLILVNAVAPLLYAYGSMRGIPEIAEKGVALLESLPPEDNGIVREWGSLGFAAADALRTQALIHLRKEYCDARKCLYCRFGHHLLGRTARDGDVELEYKC